VDQPPTSNSAERYWCKLVQLASSGWSPAAGGACIDSISAKRDGARYCPVRSQERDDTFAQRRREVILATAKFEDFDRFWNTFSTKGAEKRKQYGSKGAHVFRDPNDSDRAWVVFDWDEEGWQNFISDPDVPAIFQEGGIQGRPVSAELAREHDA
jgi:hypothetical protein